MTALAARAKPREPLVRICASNVYKLGNHFVASSAAFNPSAAPVIAGFR